MSLTGSSAHLKSNHCVLINEIQALISSSLQQWQSQSTQTSLGAGWKVSFPKKTGPQLLEEEVKTSSPQNNQYSSPCCLCTWTILQWVTALCLALPTLYLLYFSSGTRTTGLKIPERMGLYLGYLFVTTSSSLLSTDQASINVCSCGIFTLSFVTDGLLVLSFF